MANERLTLANLGGGELQADFEAAMERVADSYSDEDLKDRPRVLTVKITMTKEEVGGYYKTKHVIELKLPAKEKAGVAWLKGDSFETESLCKDTPQMGLPGVVDAKVTSLDSVRKG